MKKIYKNFPLLGNSPYLQTYQIYLYIQDFANMQNSMNIFLKFFPNLIYGGLMYTSLHFPLRNSCIVTLCYLKGHYDKPKL